MSVETPEVLFQVEDLHFTYPGGVRGLCGCSLAIRRGARTAVLGANGAGKTTLFLHLNGILKPQAGRIIHAGQPIAYSRRGMRELRARVGLVFQNPDSQLFSASVAEDVSFGPLNLALTRKEVVRRVEAALGRVGMSDCAARPVQSLSFGQKKRVAIAGVLAMEPELLILDEPMAGLDPAMQRDLAAILESLHREGMTLIVATHDVDFAYGWADALAVLSDGRCRAVWEGGEQGGMLDRLRDFDLGTPRVAELAGILRERGLLAPGDGPRNHQDLLKALKKIP